MYMYMRNRSAVNMGFILFFFCVLSFGCVIIKCVARCGKNSRWALNWTRYVFPTVLFAQHDGKHLSDNCSRDGTGIGGILHIAIDASKVCLKVDYATDNWLATSLYTYLSHTILFHTVSLTLSPTAPIAQWSGKLGRQLSNNFHLIDLKCATKRFSPSFPFSV